MDIESLELWAGRLGAVAVILFLAVAFAQMWRASRRPRGRATGRGRQVLRMPFYFLYGILLAGVCFFLWRPLPLALGTQMRLVLLLLGSLLFCGGLALYGWGMRALGEMFNASSGFGVVLHAGHRLITSGPFAIVRHPMYAGVQAATFGALLLYRTWATAFLALAFLGLVVRARKEEQALAAEFGDEWQDYSRRVPGWLPRFK